MKWYRNNFICEFISVIVSLLLGNNTSEFCLDDLTNSVHLLKYMVNGRRQATRTELWFISNDRTHGQGHRIEKSTEKKHTNIYTKCGMWMNQIDEWKKSHELNSYDVEWYWTKFQECYDGIYIPCSDKGRYDGMCSMCSTSIVCSLQIDIDIHNHIISPE